VENFLPQQHALWGSDLKELQDLLGEVHDLDVLCATALEIAAFPDAESRARWLAKVNAEREKRVTRYRELMVGRESLWRVWRTALPSGAGLRAAALSRLRVWAGYLDPDFVHSQRVARLALALYDGLRAQGLMAARVGMETEAGSSADEWREVLQAAAFMHDVGNAKGAENHQKKTYRMIRGLTCPLGWSARELELAAVVARYHRGALPHPRGKTLQLLELPDRRVVVELAGVLRLAKALDSRNGHEPRVEVQRQDDLVLVRAAGYSALERSAEQVAAARHLLETVLRRPVMVRALRVAAGRRQAKRPVLVEKRQHALREISRPYGT
jgi:exopolyphosphatase/guanosine-5'-triphosphate,3'-diphosphate pyrophosphatase